MRAYDVLIKMWLGQSMPLPLYRLNARKGIVIARKTSLHNDHEQVLDFFSSRFLPFSLYCCPFSSTRCKTIEIQNAWPWRVNTSFLIIVNLLPCQQSITGKYINARLTYEPILRHNPNHTLFYILQRSPQAVLRFLRWFQNLSLRLISRRKQRCLQFFVMKHHSS